MIIMPDTFDDKKRSEVMSKVKNKNTWPELHIRKLLWSMGYRYRLSSKALPCKPDIVFPSRKKALFVNGCFWHGHNCKRGKLPETNRKKWEIKVQKNIERDQNNLRVLTELGWKCMVIWQCDISRSNNINLMMRLNDFLE